MTEPHNIYDKSGDSSGVRVSNFLFAVCITSASFLNEGFAVALGYPENPVANDYLSRVF